MPLPMSMDEMSARGWDVADVVIVTGDAYVDHPSFAMAILGRALEAAGFRVAILSQPDWHSCDDWRRFGRPRLFFAISAGNMDSMVNHYTANRKVRNRDAYSPGGQTGLRPDRATLAYSQRAREAFSGVPVIVGGVEASLRRFAHYDYWSDKVRGSIVRDAKADLLAYGMGERLIVSIAERLGAGETLEDLRTLRSIAFVLGAGEVPREEEAVQDPSLLADRLGGRVILLPSLEQVKTSKGAFVEATRATHGSLNPEQATTLVQYHGRQLLVVNPCDFPMSGPELDRIYGLPFTRRPHPAYVDPIPAFEMIRYSVTILRGCFGGCTFCSISAHQGKTVQSRSAESVLAELRVMGDEPGFGGVVSDVGGPTANMYQMHCGDERAGKECRRNSCLDPSLCKHLVADHSPLRGLLEAARRVPGIRKVLVASGVRMDLASRDPQYVRELVEHHVGGLLKVAPEHVDPKVLRRMGKPAANSFDRFAALFRSSCEETGLHKQYLVPYYMSGHPGCDLEAMIELACFLKRSGHRPDKVQDFIPLPFDVATCMYHTGVDPRNGESMYVARGERERRLQRALLQFFKPENYFDVRAALREAGRMDLIGGGPDALIRSKPPVEAMRARGRGDGEESRRQGRRRR